MGVNAQATQHRAPQSLKALDNTAIEHAGAWNCSSLTDWRIPVTWPQGEGKGRIKMWNYAWFAISFSTLGFRPATLCCKGQRQPELVEQKSTQTNIEILSGIWRARNSAGRRAQNAPTPAGEGFPRQPSFMKVAVNTCSIPQVVQKLFQWRLPSRVSHQQSLRLTW